MQSPAHVVGNKAEAAYRRGDLFDELRRLMADWATYCAGGGATGAQVTPIKGGGGGVRDDNFDDFYSSNEEDEDQVPGYLAKRLTRDALANSLEGFALSMQPGWNLDRLAHEMRLDLATADRVALHSPNRQSNADTRAELQRRSASASKLSHKLGKKLSQEAHVAIWRYSLKHWKGEGAKRRGVSIFGLPTLLRRFRAVEAELAWLSGFLLDVGLELPSQLPRWTERETREIRIERAMALIHIFLTAFDVPKRWGSVFGDFYQRSVSLAFEEKDIPDFEGIITESRKRHRE